MNYLLITLTLVSYFCSIFFAIQDRRNPLERPLIYGNGNFLWIVILLLGFGPMVLAGYWSFLSFGWLGFLILAIVRFILLPTLFNKTVKDFMDRKGI